MLLVTNFFIKYFYVFIYDKLKNLVTKFNRNSEH